MKFIMFSLLLTFCLASLSHAQSKYSIERLEQLSDENLDLYLQQALKKQKTGRGYNIAGAVFAGIGGAGIIWAAADDSGFYAGTIMAMVGIGGGLICWAIGVPMKNKGEKREKRIRSVQESRSLGVNLKISPGLHYNAMAQSHQPGLTIGLTF